MCVCVCVCRSLTGKGDEDRQFWDELYEEERQLLKLSHPDARHLFVVLYTMAVICLKKGTRETFIEGDGHFKRAQASHERCLHVYGRPKGSVSASWPNPEGTVAHFLVEFATEIYGASNSKDVQQLKRKYDRLNQSFLPKEAVQQILAGAARGLTAAEALRQQQQQQQESGSAVGMEASRGGMAVGDAVVHTKTQQKGVIKEMSAKKYAVLLSDNKTVARLDADLLVRRAHDMDDECPICVEPFSKAPVTISCGHEFCAACLQLVRDSSYGGDARTTPCPMCRKLLTDADWQSVEAVLETLPEVTIRKEYELKAKTVDREHIGRLFAGAQTADDFAEAAQKAAVYRNKEAEKHTVEHIDALLYGAHSADTPGARMKAIIAKVTDVAANDADAYGDGDQGHLDLVSDKNADTFSALWCTGMDVTDLATAQQYSTFMAACLFGIPEFLNKELGEAADAEAKLHLLEQRFSLMRLTPLMACIIGERQFKPVSRGGEVMAQKSPKDSGHVRALKLLLKAGARTNALDVAGKSALFHATSHATTELGLHMAAMLHNYGADPDQEDRFGKLPLTDAIMGGRDELILFLRKLGANALKQTRGNNPTPMEMLPGHSAMINKLRSEYCTHCGKAGSAQRNAGARYLSKCAGCAKTRYCDKTCQSAHWKAGHNVMCKRAIARAKLGDSTAGTADNTNDGRNGTYTHVEVSKRV